jgi:hypothetical protein
MKLPSGLLYVCAGALLVLTGTLEPNAAYGNEKPAVTTFDNVTYFERSTNLGTKDAGTVGQYEFTPAGQTDLNAWSQMVTLIEYRKVRTGEDLAKTANAVLGTYTSNGGKVLRTNSVPRTSSKPAEYFVAVILPGSHYLEAAFARFRMNGGIGTAIVYSRRFYGKTSADDFGAWAKTHGASTEQTLMQWDAMPRL